MRLRQRISGYQVTVFTSPTPLRAGPVDVSVLVQDDSTGEWVPEARALVRLTARGSGQSLEYAARTEAATNKLLRAAVFELPGPGWWDVDVVVNGPKGSAQSRFAVEVSAPAPRWLELWPWFGWPVLAVAVFGLYRALVRGDPRRRVPSARCGTTSRDG